MDRIESGAVLAAALVLAGALGVLPGGAAVASPAPGAGGAGGAPAAPAPAVMTYTLALGGTAAAPTSMPGPGLQSMMSAAALRLAITCAPPLDCANVSVTSDPPAPGAAAPASPRQLSGGTRAAVTYEVPAEAASVAVRYGGVAAPLFQMTLAPPDTPRADARAGGTRARPGDAPAASSLADLLATRCPVQRYELAPNEVLVTPRGSLLSPLPPRFAESDTLRVTVIADERLIGALGVKRRSAARTVTHTILGEGIDIRKPLAELERQSERERTCAVQSFSVGDFAPGTGEVELTATLDAQPVPLGSFQVLVDPVYVGMFSIGAIWTPLLAPDFGLATRDGAQVITQSHTGSRRLGYALLFTPFLWDGLERNARRPFRLDRFYRHINPSVGFLLEDPLDNVLLGATLDVQSTVLVTAGAIFSDVRRLDGVAAGDPFAGTAEQIPTTRSWRRRWFVGVSVDLRVGVKLLRGILGTAAGS